MRCTENAVNDKTNNAALVERVNDVIMSGGERRKKWSSRTYKIINSQGRDTSAVGKFQLT